MRGAGARRRVGTAPLDGLPYRRVNVRCVTPLGELTDSIS
jgi:hypothetical protein